MDHRAYHDYDGKCLILRFAEDKRISFSLACEGSLVRIRGNFLAHLCLQMGTFTFLRWMADRQQTFGLSFDHEVVRC